MTIEKRKYRRVALDTAVEAESGGKPLHVESRNISVGGMLARASVTLPQHAAVNLRFTLPGSPSVIQATATVQHVSPDAFMGLQFEGLSAAALAAIEDYVNRQAEDPASKRKSKRVPFVAKVEAQAGGFPFIAVAEDISEGGLSVRTASPLEEGAILHLKFTLPQSDREITVSGTVRQVSPGTGMGIQFNDLAAGDREVIRGYVQSA